eukprot:3188983-Amphidinium_carterae.1
MTSCRKHWPATGAARVELPPCAECYAKCAVASAENIRQLGADHTAPIKFKQRTIPTSVLPISRSAN